MEILKTVITLMQTIITLGGGIWLLWGVIVLAGALKDKNGPQLQSGIWQIVGGAMIILVAQLFGTLTLPSFITLMLGV